MPTHTLLRVLAIVVTAATFLATRESQAWHIVVATVGLGHYLIGLLYSRRQLADVVGRRRNWVPLLALTLAGAGLYLTRFPLLVYFGVHHALNEVYLLNRTIPPGVEPRLRRWRASGLAVNLLLYFFLVRHSFHISYAERPTLFVGLSLGLAVAYATFFAWLYRLRTSLTRRQIVDNCSLEIVAIALVAASFVTRFSYLQIVFYHFVFWAMFPAVGLWRQGAASLARYVGLTAGVLGVFVAIDLAAMGRGMGIVRSFWDQFIFWSYVHITLSLAVSAANPEWLRRLFGSRPTRVVVPEVRRASGGFGTPVNLAVGAEGTGAQSS